ARFASTATTQCMCSSSKNRNSSVAWFRALPTRSKRSVAWLLVLRSRSFFQNSCSHLFASRLTGYSLVRRPFPLLEDVFLTEHRKRVMFIPLVIGQFNQP